MIRRAAKFMCFVFKALYHHLPQNISSSHVDSEIICRYVPERRRLLLFLDIFIEIGELCDKRYVADGFSNGNAHGPPRDDCTSPLY